VRVGSHLSSDGRSFGRRRRGADRAPLISVRSRRCYDVPMGHDRRLRPSLQSESPIFGKRRASTSRLGRWRRACVATFWCAIFLAFVATPIIPALTLAPWVGFTELNVTYVVEDEKTGRSIEGAALDFRNEPDRPVPNRGESTDSTFNTNAAGKVIRKWHCLCGGRGWTYSVEVPWVMFQVSAPEFVMTEWINLNDYRFRAVRRGSARSSLDIKIPLRRKVPKPLNGETGRSEPIPSP
jgi:hypothetical protein